MENGADICNWWGDILFVCNFTELDQYQTNYDNYNAVHGGGYDQSSPASEIQQNLLKYVQQYQEKQDGLSIFDDPSAVSRLHNMFGLRTWMWWPENLSLPLL